MRIGESIQVRVDALDGNGLGAGVRTDAPDRAVVVEDGLPGEAGRAVVLHVGATVLVRLVERRATSPERRAPPCPRWTAQSPCRLMHLDDDAQAREKTRRVADALSAAGVTATLQPLVRAPRNLGWRSRAIFVVAKTRQGRYVLGAYRRGTHLVQTMAGCPLEEPAIAAAAAALTDAIAAAGLPLADLQLPVASDEGCGAPLALADALRPRRAHAERLSEAGLRYVALRANAAGEVTCALLATEGRLPGAAAVAEAAMRACPALVGVHLGASGLGDAIFGPGPLEPLPGSRPLVDTLEGLGFELGPRAFFQVHRAAAAALHAHATALALEGAPEAPLVVDTYAGVGALALRLAARGARVIAIESVPDAAEDARRSAARNSLRVEVRCDDAARALAALGEQPYAIVLNPPRKGCSPEALAAAAAARPTRLVYVSCNPASLARDAARLAALGYALAEVTPFDLFPHAEHVECVARFSPA